MTTTENLIDRLLSFLPGAKTYLVGLAMIATGLVQIIGAYESGAMLGPTLTGGVEMVLEGFAVMTLRRGIKTASAPVAPPPPGHFYREPEVVIPDPRIMGNPR